MLEAKEMVVETCANLVAHYGKKNGVSSNEIKIRIDLEHLNGKPVFGIFSHSTLVEKSTLKEVIKVAGGGGFAIVIGFYVKSIIKDIFEQSLKQLEMTDSKQIFLLLYVQNNDKGVTFPHIALYKGKDFLWSLPIAEVMDASLAQLKS